jgi:hypothetical protein
MESEPTLPVTPDEARFALEEIDRVGRHIRKTIGTGRAAPMLILWGSIWVVGFTGQQFLPHSYRLWLGLDAVGIAISFFSRWNRSTPIKHPHNARIGFSWMILFIFAGLWCSLISPWEMSHADAWSAYAPFMERKMALLWVTVCMFAYMIMGLWLDRFFLWLGGIVTLLALVGYFFIRDYFFLWIAIAGGGSLIASGVFIRKFWR